MEDFREAASDYRRAWIASAKEREAEVTLRSFRREYRESEPRGEDTYNIVSSLSRLKRKRQVWFFNAPKSPAVNKVSKVCDEYRWRLHRIPGVIGVGVSLKMKANKVTRIPCVVVFVTRKLKRGRFKVIPNEIKGVPTDVVESGIPVLRSYTGRVRPLKPGYSVSHAKSETGTLGCFVRKRGSTSDLDVMILSNNHILANNNAASPGDSILQPGRADRGRIPKDVAANLAKFVPIRAGRPNRIDAAIAKPTGNCNLAIPGIGLPHGILQVKQTGLEVQKVGRTTGLTSGVISAYDASSGPHMYPGIGSVYFTDQIVTTGMSSEGDSGSLLVTRYDRLAVGLLFAGHAKPGRPRGADKPTDVVTYYNDIKDVLGGLGVDLVTI